MRRKTLALHDTARERSRTSCSAYPSKKNEPRATNLPNTVAFGRSSVEAEGDASCESNEATCIVLFPGAAHASITSPPFHSLPASLAATDASLPRRASAEKQELLSASVLGRHKSGMEKALEGCYREGDY